MNNKLPILMTAAVSAGGMVGADFSDDVRERMYLESIEFYIKELLVNDEARKVVFVENSGWNITAFKSKIKNLPENQIEFVSLDPDDFDLARGKGYNELISINQAIDKSKTLQDADGFMKVTGRYPVYNLRHYLQEAEKFFAAGGRFYGDMKDHKLYDFLFPHNTAKWNGHAAYTVLFATTKEFYKARLGHLYSECNDYSGRWIECVWYDELKQYRGKEKCGVRLRFNREPICGGMQGSSAQTVAFSKNNQSFKCRIMRLVGNGIRVFMPWFWF